MLLLVLRGLLGRLVLLVSVSVDFKEEDDDEEEDGEVDADKRIRSFHAAKNLDDGDGNRSIHPLANKGNKMMHSRRKLMERFILIVMAMRMSLCNGTS